MSASVIAKRALRKAKARTLTRGERLGEIALQKHISSPRAGKTLNKFGLRRSAGGQAPANETGRLALELATDPTVTANGCRVPVNYKVQETGYVEGNLLPRPLGRLSFEELRQEVKR